MIQLKGWIEAQQSFALGMRIRMRFLLRNESEDDLYVLTWFTPLEGLYSDCLSVRYGGEEIPYDGTMIKRGSPGIEDYLLLHIGETVAADFELQEAYSIKSPGEYHVTLNTIIADVFEVNISVVAARIGGLGQNVNRVPLQGGGIFFSVEPGDIGLPTKGELARSEEGGEGGGGEGRGNPKPPEFIGGDAIKRAALVAAHNGCFFLCEEAIARLANDTKYKRWFGLFDNGRFSRVKGSFISIVKKMRVATFIYNLTETGCKQAWFAYTYHGVRTIWICARFWSQGSGHSHQAIIVHEHSHATALTEDHAHSLKGCLKLAVDDPETAVNNASNYEFYAEGL